MDIGWLRHRNGFLSEAGGAASLETSKTRLDGALRKLVQWKVPLPLTV